MTLSSSVSTAEGRTVAVEVAAGDGPVLLLAHGAGSSAWFLREAFGSPALAAGWRLATVDLPGHGGAGPAPSVADHHLDRYAEDLAAVAAEVGACVLGGVSIGGMAAVRAVATGMVANGPGAIEAVVSVIPGWTGRSQPGEGPHAAVAAEVRRDGVEGMLARLEADPDLPDWIREVVVRDYRRHDPVSLAAALEALDGGDAPSVDEVAGLPVPLALVGWPDDPGHPLEVAFSWSAALPRSALAMTSIPAMQRDRTAFGRAALAALYELGITGGLR